MTAHLRNVERIWLPSKAAEVTHAHLREAAAKGCEGLALFVGVQDDRDFWIKEALIPPQQGIRTPDGVCVVMESDALFQLNLWLLKHQMLLIGQIHSHPGEAYHSPTDDQYAVATKAGSISLVVPDFAEAPFSLARCATYRLGHDGDWRELSPESAASLIRMAD